MLAAIGNKSVNEGSNLSFTATATDADVPANTLSFSLVNGTTGCGPSVICTVPSGATINSSTGAFSWTPTEAQGPGTYRFFVKVSDNGSPILSDDEEITVTVNEVNVAPVLAAIGNKSVNEGSNLSFTATATDADVPANTLSFSLVNGTTGCGPSVICTVPSGATINSSTGAFNWTTSDNGTFRFKVRVTDNGSPTLSATEEITVTVNNVAPTVTDPTVTVNNVSGDIVATMKYADPAPPTHKRQPSNTV